jgi:hypothetical protein
MSDSDVVIYNNSQNRSPTTFQKPNNHLDDDSLVVFDKSADHINFIEQDS